MAKTGDVGCVYLLHFERPLKHAKHYTGWTKNSTTLPMRLDHHRAGTGARLMAVLAAKGIEWSLVKTEEGDRNRERRLKKQGGASRRCPMCKAMRLA